MPPVIKNLKKQILELGRLFESRLRESHSFNLFREKYQSLSLSAQKAIKYFIVCLLASVILYLPALYLISSLSNWAELKSKYNLSLDILKIRERKSSFFLKDSKSSVSAQIQRAFQKYTEEGSLSQKDKKSPQSKFVSQIDYSLKAPQLNVRQAIQLGSDLQALSQVRLNGITFEENSEYPKHYDIHYELTAFFFESPSLQPIGTKKKRAKRKPRKRKAVDKKSPNSGEAGPAPQKKRDFPVF